MGVIATIIVPIYNEENYIIEFLNSLEEQDYAKNLMEIFLIDGQSSDRTVDFIQQFIHQSNLNIKLFDNPKRSQASAMNLGLANSRGRYIIRLDAHAYYPFNYISTAIRLLAETDADNVGFCIDTQGKTKKGKLFAKILSSKFGVGNSSFRIKEKIMEADTVPFGAFKRETLKKLGGFDERLLSNEDNDINYRIIESGGRILLSNECEPVYYTRDTIDGLVKMALRNGKWNVMTLFYRKGAMKIRHFIPLLFVLSIIVLSLLGCLSTLFVYLLIGEIIVYCLLAVYFASKVAEDALEVGQLVCLFMLFHITYGIGSIRGAIAYSKLFSQSLFSR